MLESAARLMAGFSVVAVLILLLSGFTRRSRLAGGWLSRLWTVLLLGGLALLQFAHLQSLAGRETFGTGSRIYVALLFLVAPAFYLFFRGVLQLRREESPWILACFVPVLLAPWLDVAIAVPLSFALGSAYAIHLGVLVFRLRGQRQRFRLELVGMGLFALIALIVLAFGISLPLYGFNGFVLAYSILIGLALALAIHVLIEFPDIGEKASDAVVSTYAVTTLAQVDRERAVGRLRQLMDEQVFTDESLKLASLAGMLDLSPHQLSELINTQFGVGYSRYIREHRVAAAQRMLLAEPEASVLSVGLSVGFTSQSNFYAAFREITGEVPGRYRSQQASGADRIPK
ncbi:helix-turn-helix domain-containing protein [Dokdonella sp.]|uniref:helix-turn-helix domain-containing protein n=1 Tax=Dokdonella sp. TaxID=2291710 RepID=UPI003529B752